MTTSRKLPRFRRRACQGSSLIELLVSLSLTGVTLLSAAPLLGEIRANSLASKSCEGLAEFLRFARALALAQRSEIRIEIANRNELEILRKGGSQKMARFYSAAQRVSTRLPAGQALVFRSDFSASATQLVAAYPGKICLIKISLRGRITEELKP